MELAKILKQLRTQAELSQADLAEKLDVHVQTVSKWERNISLPDFSMLGLIAKQFQIKFDQLFGIDDANSVDGEFNNIKMGESIRALRKHKQQSQRELAEQIGVGADVVSKWERGYVCPDIERFKELCDYFCVLPSELYYSNFKTDVDDFEENQIVEFSSLQKSQKRLVFIVVIALVIAVAIAASCVLFLYLYKNPDDNQNQTITEDAKDDNLEEEQISQEEQTFAVPVLEYTILRANEVIWSDYFNRYEYIRGIDFDVELGQEVFAIMDGEITSIVTPNEVQASDIDNPGAEITIENGEYKAIYWSINIKDNIEVGSKVKKGDVLGTVANHHRMRVQRFDDGTLHVELYKNDEFLILKDVLNIQ